jgi:predicted ATPase
MTNEFKQIEIEADAEFNRILNKIGEQEATPTIDNIYFIPKQYTKMVANGFSRGFLLYGNAGLGKTNSVIKAFKEVDKHPSYNEKARGS